MKGGVAFIEERIVESTLVGKWHQVSGDACNLIVFQEKRKRVKQNASKSWAKIALGFGIVLVILFIMGGYSYYKASELDELTTDLARANRRTSAAANTRFNFVSGVLATRGYIPDST